MIKFKMFVFTIIICFFSVFSTAIAKIDAKAEYQENVIKLSDSDDLKIEQVQTGSFVHKGNATYLKKGHVLLGKKVAATITDIIKQGDSYLIKYRRPRLDEIYKSLVLDGKSN